MSYYSLSLGSCDGISLEEIWTMGTSCPWAYSVWDLLADGGPGMIIYLVWLVLLNVTFQREVIAKPPEGGGLWAVGLYLSFLTPLGLPLGYIVASLLPIASLQRLPFLRHRLTWLLLFALLWSLLMVIWINAPAGEAKKSSSYLSREFALTLPNQKTQGTADFTAAIASKPQNFAFRGS